MTQGKLTESKKMDEERLVWMKGARKNIDNGLITVGK